MNTFIGGALLGFGLCTFMIWVLHGLFDPTFTVAFLAPTVIYVIAKRAAG